MEAEISPVNAPLGLSCTFCAPRARCDPSMAAPTADRAVKGGQRTTFTLGSMPTAAEMALTSSTPSVAVLFIFQLPAMRGVRLDILLI